MLLTDSNSEEDRRCRKSMSNSPTEDKNLCSNSNFKSSALSEMKKLKDYKWTSSPSPVNYTSDDNDDNITNAPLNLSTTANDSSKTEPKHSIPQFLSLPNSNPIAQLVLTSGEMVQGIQGAQVFVPTSKGLAKQTVLTIPITHVTNDQVINLSINNGQTIPITVGELLKLAMPKGICKDGVAEDKIMNELLKLSEQTSVYMAEYLKSALKHSDVYRNHSEDSKIICESESENSNSTDKDHKEESYSIDENSNAKSIRIAHEEVNRIARGSCTDYSSKSSGLFASQNSTIPIMYDDSHNQIQARSKAQKRVHESNLYTDRRSHKKIENQLMIQDRPSSILSEPIDKPILLSRRHEEPSSTISNDHESNFNFDNNITFKQEELSPDSYDESDLDDIKEFAKSFKLRRLSMGLTQTQVGQALNIAEGPAYSQSAICSALASQMYAAHIASQQHSMFEKLDITPKSAQKIKPVLEQWMKEAEESRNGQGLLTDFIGLESSKKRKRRTSFTPQALDLLNRHFEHNTHPSGTEITTLAHQLGYDREVIRIWFCNKRQALKNTVRLMSKHMI